MIVRTDTNRKKTSIFTWKLKLLTIIIYFIAVFLTEIFYRKPLSKLTIEFVEKSQIYIDNPDFFKFLQIFAISGSTSFFASVFIVTFNFTNIFKSYLLLMIVVINSFFTGTLKLIYQSPRPFYETVNNIIPYGCDMGFGGPSLHSLGSTAFYLALWSIIFDSRSLKQRQVLKISLLAFIMIFLLCIMIARVLVGDHSFNNAIFGGLLGLGVYLVFFWLFEINTNDSKQFLTFIMMKFGYYILINLALFITLLGIVYFKKPLDEDLRESWKERILKKCGYVYENIMFENDAYLMFASVFSNFAAYVGLKHEFIYTFKSSVNNWTKYNFSLEAKDDDSFLSSIDFTKDTQWNHNNCLNSCLRMMVIILFTLGIVSPYIFISYYHSFWMIFFVKLLIPFSVLFYFNFYIVKHILKFLRLVNFSSNNLLTNPEEVH